MGISYRACSYYNHRVLTLQSFVFWRYDYELLLLGYEYLRLVQLVPKKNNAKVVAISRTNLREKLIGIILCLATILVTFGVYKYFGQEIKNENYIDIFTSGLFFTAMWYMAIKKIENWTLWIIADLITVPLYAYRGLGMLSLQYLIFTVLAIQGFLEWKKSLDKSPAMS
jgi:nicotinamide mononucleotide transporter